MSTKIKTVLLELDPSLAMPSEETPLRDNLSVASRTGRNLWIASDETATLERLTQVEPGRFAAHARFPLADFLTLPDDDVAEVDVEGLAHDEGWLWVIGSHSLKRKKAKAGRGDDAEELERLATVKRDANRYLLARIPHVTDASGDVVLVREGDDGKGGTRRAAQLKGDARGNELVDAIVDDAHLAPFLEIPGKDNGFDVEGLAVQGGRVYLGLRGPVLRGWAVILSIEVERDEDDARVLRLVKRMVGEDEDGKPVRRRYAKHFVNLHGMGVRELHAEGDDLIILAGPTMVLDGTLAVFRWTGGARATEDRLVPKSEVVRLFDVPHGTGERSGTDRAEGMTLWPREGVQGACDLLVVYDSPADERRRGDGGVMADLFPMP